MVVSTKRRVDCYMMNYSQPTCGTRVGSGLASCTCGCGRRACPQNTAVETCVGKHFLLANTQENGECPISGEVGVRYYKFGINEGNFRLEDLVEPLGRNSPVMPW